MPIFSASVGVISLFSLHMQLLICSLFQDRETMNLLKFFGDAGLTITTQLLAQILSNPVPNTQQLCWFSSQVVIPTSKRLQCLCYCFISLRINYSATRRDFGFTLTHNKVKESCSLVSKSTLDGRCLFRTVRPLQHLAEFQAPHLILDCLMGLFRYPLFGQSHTEFITLHTFQNFKLSKNFILSDYNIYMYIFSKRILFFIIF